MPCCFPPVSRFDFNILHDSKGSQFFKPPSRCRRTEKTASIAGSGREYGAFLTLVHSGEIRSEPRLWRNESVRASAAARACAGIHVRPPAALFLLRFSCYPLRKKPLVRCAPEACYSDNKRCCWSSPKPSTGSSIPAPGKWRTAHKPRFCRRR